MKDDLFGTKRKGNQVLPMTLRTDIKKTNASYILVWTVWKCKSDKSSR